MSVHIHGWHGIYNMHITEHAAIYVHVCLCPIVSVAVEESDNNEMHTGPRREEEEDEVSQLPGDLYQPMVLGDDLYLHVD